ncbi:MAG: WD40 domain-containing protein [Leptolyngbyaceae cyanobacterium HOT.MB2.61]|nr:WD40 domain-containing protein [Leptolyngbyaceae cyanobacterium HOT.MB2.61]
MAIQQSIAKLTGCSVFLALATGIAMGETVSLMVLQPLQSLRAESLVLAARSKSLQVQLVKTLSGHGNTVNAVAIAPDGNTLISGSSDRSIKI